MNPDQVDISERGRVQQALRESEERFRLAAQAGGMYAFSWDVATDIIERSGESAKILGIDEATPLTGQQVFESIHPDDREGVLAAMARLSPEKPFLQATCRIVRPDMSVIWVERHCRAYFDRHSKVKHMVGMVVDITGRKLVEEELARAKERLCLAIESGLVGGWEWDVKSGKTHWFGKAHAQLGMPDDTVGSRKEFWKRVHEGDCDALRQAMQLAKVRHEGFIHDFRVVWSDGTIHWLRSRGRYYYAENGEAERMLGISTDITESKQAEQALRESEQRLRLATQVGRMYAYEWDVTTNVVVRSSEHLNILGLTEPLRFPHQQFVDSIHPDDRAKFLAAIAGLTPDNPTGEVTYRLMPSNDSLVWLKSNGRGFFDAEGRMVRVIGMVADVTAQKLAEEALRASGERLSLAQKIAGIGTFERNIRTGVNTWTAEMEAMYGLPPGGFGQTRMAFENLVHPDDRADVMKLVDEALKTGQPVSGEWRVIWPDRSVHWIAGRWQALMDDSGEPLRVIGANIDITERKRTEEALSGLARKLVEAQEQERAHIARELHDDINQRLAVLAIECDCLRERTDLPRQVRRYAQQLQELAADISSRVYALSHELHSSTLDALGLVKGMKGWCKEFGNRQKMEIDFKSDNVPSVPHEISLCLFRVIQEALRNAAKHSGTKRIEVQLSATAGKIHLIVSDSGKGFDIETIKRKHGLGLTSMQERVRLVGGTIMIDSKPMAGTTIHVCVPLREARNTQKAHA